MKSKPITCFQTYYPNEKKKKDLKFKKNENK